MSPRQDLIPLGLDKFSLAVKYLIRGQQIQGAMPMAGVVPRYEPRTECPRFIQRTEAFRIRYPALEGREQAFDKGIVVADMRAASGDPDFELLKHFHQIRLLHRTSVIRVDGQKRGIRNPGFNRIGQDIPRHKAILTDFHGPGDEFTAEEIHKRVEIAEPARDAKPHRGVSSPEEFHLQALAEPDVNLSAHPAPIFQPLGLTSKFQCGNRPGFEFATANSHLPALVL